MSKPSKMSKKARKGKRPNLGMQSVIYGIDNLSLIHI